MPHPIVISSDQDVLSVFTRHYQTVIDFRSETHAALESCRKILLPLIVILAARMREERALPTEDLIDMLSEPMARMDAILDELVRDYEDAARQMELITKLAS